VLSERTRLAMPLSVVFLLFSALDWIVFPQHAARWLLYRVVVLAAVVAIDQVAALSRRLRGFSVAILLSFAFSSTVAVMTYETGGFASSYYVGLIVLATAVFVLFPLDYRRGLTVLGIILAPYLMLGFAHGEAELRQVTNNLGFLLSAGGFLVLGGHLGTRLLIEQHRAETRLQALVLQLEDHSRRDPLTQLFNRRHLAEHLANVLPTRLADLPTSFALADLDQFKRVNDIYGHQAGDAILKEVAQAIRSAIRASDIAFRYGGDEFAIIFRSSDAEEAAHAAERLRATIEKREVRCQGAALELSLSIGLTTALPKESITTVVARADEALYLAKNGGRNRVVAVHRSRPTEQTPELRLSGS
jgi:diguanylate cyclase (GGDEF)-like protein